MGVHRDPARTYRLAGTSTPGEVVFQVAVEETDLHVVAERDLSRGMADRVRSLRAQLTSYIAIHTAFAESLSPVRVPSSAPEIVRRMADAAERFDVGPMAAVAGTMAQMTAEPFVSESPNLLVENGGDLYLSSTRERVVGLLSDPKAGMAIGLRLTEDAFPVAICASSGRIGHSLSFGACDLVAVRAGQAAVADAAATALANRIHRPDDLEGACGLAAEWRERGVEGLFAACGGRLAGWGNLELTPLS